MKACYDCGSTLDGHHTKLCDLAPKNAVRNLPAVKGTHYWNEVIPEEVILAAKRRHTIHEADVTQPMITKLKRDARNHPALQRWTVCAVCKYCSRGFTYNLLIGTYNCGACNRSACIMASMRDHM